MAETSNTGKRKRSESEDAVVFFSRSADKGLKSLSNFCEIEGLLTIPEDFELELLRGIKFPSVENAFQAAKYAGYAAPSSAFVKRTQRPLYLSNPENDRARKMIPINVLGKLNPREAKTFGGKKGMLKNDFQLTDPLDWENDSKRIMNALIRLRYQQDAAFKASILHFARKGKKFYHYERSGAKSFWGGYFPKAGGPWVGNNELGKIMNQLARE
jgi:predicted NAD-dependent protein-ADP-ribosyltransferase YbiA (DUF1768 family)